MSSVGDGDRSGNGWRAVPGPFAKAEPGPLGMHLDLDAWEPIHAFVRAEQMIAELRDLQARIADPDRREAAVVAIREYESRARADLGRKREAFLEAIDYASALAGRVVPCTLSERDAYTFEWCMQFAIAQTHEVPSEESPRRTNELATALCAALYLAAQYPEIARRVTREQWTEALELWREDDERPDERQRPNATKWPGIAAIAKASWDESNVQAATWKRCWLDRKPSVRWRLTDR